MKHSTQEGEEDLVTRERRLVYYALENCRTFFIFIIVLYDDLLLQYYAIFRRLILLKWVSIETSMAER